MRGSATRPPPVSPWGPVCGGIVTAISLTLLLLLCVGWFKRRRRKTEEDYSDECNLASEAKFGSLYLYQSMDDPPHPSPIGQSLHVTTISTSRDQTSAPRRWLSSQWSMMSVPGGGDDHSTSTSGVSSQLDDVEALETELVRFLNLNDLTDLLIDRHRISVGKTLLQRERCTFAFGSLRYFTPSYTCCTKPVSVALYKDMSSDTDRLHLLKNLQCVSRLSHPRVLAMLGVCPLGGPGAWPGVLVVTARTHRLVILLNLLHWTRDNNPELLSLHLAMTLTIQLCEGAIYLEKMGIIHKNLASDTVFLSPSCSALIGGVEPHPLVVSRRKGAVRWWPTETMVQSKFARRSVVWSLGVVLWEILTLGSRPYPHLTTDKQVTTYVVNGNRLVRPENCPDYLYRVLLCCWDDDPGRRPSLPALLTTLKELRQEVHHDVISEHVYLEKDNFLEDEYV